MEVKEYCHIIAITITIRLDLALQMTQRTRRVSVRQNTEGHQEILIPLQVHNVNRDATYSSDQQESHLHQHLVEQLEEWKARCQHLESHYEKLELFKEKYDSVLKENTQLNAQCKQKDYEVEDLKRDLERKEEEMSAAVRRRRAEMEDIGKSYKKEVDGLRQELEGCQTKLSSIESLERKKRRDLQNQLSKIKEQLSEASEEISSTKQSLQRYKSENSSLKRKLQEMELNREMPLDRNANMASQIHLDNLAGQLRQKDDIILNLKDALLKLEQTLKQEADRHRNLLRQAEDTRLESENRNKRVAGELDRLKGVERETESQERQIVKLNKIILTKNDEIEILLHKIDTFKVRDKQTTRTNAETIDQEYNIQFHKLQQELTDKYKRQKKEKELLEDSLRQLQGQFELRLGEKNGLLEERNLGILNLERELEALKRNYISSMQGFESADKKHIQLEGSFQKTLQQRDVHIHQLAAYVSRLEDEITYSQKEKDQLVDNTRTLEQKFLQDISSLENYIRSTQINQSQYSVTEIQELYEAKLSSKDELIELLKLKIKGFEGNDITLLKTKGSFYR